MPRQLKPQCFVAAADVLFLVFASFSSSSSPRFLLLFLSVCWLLFLVTLSLPLLLSSEVFLILSFTGEDVKDRQIPNCCRVTWSVSGYGRCSDSACPRHDLPRPLLTTQRE